LDLLLAVLFLVDGKSRVAFLCFSRVLCLQ
jgi:hypothetical protein